MFRDTIHGVLCFMPRVSCDTLQALYIFIEIIITDFVITQTKVFYLLINLY